MRAVSTIAGILLAAAAGWLSPGLHVAQAASPACAPTRTDSLGPFYVPQAPERDRTGQGLVITGVVRSSSDCRPLAQALIEWWSANPQGDYDEAHRAVQHSGSAGHYEYNTDFPGRYPGRPPHLHLRVTAPEHRPLVTQIYPQEGQTAMTLDLVLRPH